MGVNPKIGGKAPKMDRENNEKSYEQMDDLGVFPLFSERSIYGIFTYMTGWLFMVN